MILWSPQKRKSRSFCEINVFVFSLFSFTKNEKQFNIKYYYTMRYFLLEKYRI